MASMIDITKPPTGGPVVSMDVRNNFATAASEITALQSGSLPASGGTLTGPLVIQDVSYVDKTTASLLLTATQPNAVAGLHIVTQPGTTGWPSIVIDAQPGQANFVLGNKVGLSRWSMQLGTTEAETGGNAGSNFYLNRFDDSGVQIDANFTVGIRRATGNLSVKQGIRLGILDFGSYTGNGLAITPGVATTDPVTFLQSGTGGFVINGQISSVIPVAGSGAAGGVLTLVATSGDGVGAGGQLIFNAGNGGATTTGGGGQIRLQAGWGGSGNAPGGPIVIQAGSGANNGGAGGYLNLFSGNGNYGSAGAVNITGGNGAGTGVGGDINIAGGSGSGSGSGGNGGSVTISSGPAYGGTAIGGNVIIQAIAGGATKGNLRLDLTNFRAMRIVALPTTDPAITDAIWASSNILVRSGFTKATVAGSRGGNAALASLITALANFGLITDNTTA